MGTQPFRCQDIKGLSPAVEATRAEEIFVLNGRNYIFDTRGPKSVFGNRLLLPQAIGAPEHVQGIRIKIRGGDRCFTITSDAILEWDEVAGGWRVIYLTPDLRGAPYRWTWGYLNGNLFLCHPRTGVLVYNVDSGLCRPHDGVGTPEEAISICVDNGRLVVMTPTILAWSAPSDGMNFNPEIGGAGFQLISDSVPGYPIMCSSYTKGVLTWTTGGVLRSEFAGDSAVYRHRALVTEYRPVNSFCTCKVDDNTVVVLDERGLFQSKGDTPTPFAPLFNEFLSAYIQDNNLNVGQNVRLEWDDLRRLMFVSVSLTYSSPLYEQAFVLYPNLDKWGQFNETHYGILPLRIQVSERADDYAAFVDSRAAVRYWSDVGSRELDSRTSAIRAGQNLYYPVIQVPVSYPDEEDQGRALGSAGALSTFDSSGITQRAGYYSPGVTTPAIPELTGLDASIQFGFFRMQGQTASDEMSEILNVLVRSTQSGDRDRVSVDFNLVPAATEDYNFESGTEDYGLNSLNYVNHGLRIIGTIDGVSEFASAVPDLVGFVKGARYYSCSVTGVWHIIEFTADAVGESFHPVTFELTATSAGRLM